MIMKALSRLRSHLISSILICILIVTITVTMQIVHSSSVSAQSPTSLNADIIRLRTRIDRLESEINRVNKSRNNQISSPDTTTPNSNLVHPPVVDGRAIGPSDPLFQRLSTLLIELKEDVKKIDKRLTAVEAKIRTDRE